mgnify:CR=1 FL=1
MEYLPLKTLSLSIQYFIDLIFLLNFSLITSYLIQLLNNVYTYLNLITSNSFNSKLSFKSDYYSNIDQVSSSKIQMEEASESSRFLKFDNPTFKYDYKSGNYFPPINNEIFSHLFTTIADITSSTAKAS